MKQCIYSASSLGTALKRARKAKKLNQKAVGLPFKIEHNGIDLSKSIEKADPLLFHLHGKPALIATGTSPP